MFYESNFGISPGFMICFLMMWGCGTNKDLPDIRSDGHTIQNVILITADDLFSNEYNPIEFVNFLTNLNAFAEEGISFTNAYVTQASCSPSRASILTGLFPHQHGQIGLSYESSPFRIHEEIPTLIEILAKNEVYSGIIGKLHITPESKFPFDFMDTNIGDTREIDKVSKKLIKFLESKPKDGKAFLMLNLFDPHAASGTFINQVSNVPNTLISPSDVSFLPSQRMYNDESKTRLASYLNSAKRFDFILQRVFDILKEHDSYNNALIIVTSDHGAEFCRGKLSCYESGIKVPLVIRHPNLTKGLKTDRITSLVDLFPTVLTAFEINSESNITGKEIFENNLITAGHDFVFSEFNYHLKNDYYPRRTVQEGDFKLIWNAKIQTSMPFETVDGDEIYISLSANNVYEDAFEIKSTYLKPPEFELYNLKNDPMETNNLSGQSDYITIMSNLKARLLDWQEKTNDNLRVPI